MAGGETRQIIGPGGYRNIDSKLGKAMGNANRALGLNELLRMEDKLQKGWRELSPDERRAAQSMMKALHKRIRVLIDRGDAGEFAPGQLARVSGPAAPAGGPGGTISAAKEVPPAQGKKTLADNIEDIARLRGRGAPQRMPPATGDFENPIKRFNTSPLKPTFREAMSEAGTKVINRGAQNATKESAAKVASRIAGMVGKDVAKSVFKAAGTAGAAVALDALSPSTVAPDEDVQLMQATGKAPSPAQAALWAQDAEEQKRGYADPRFSGALRNLDAMHASVAGPEKPEYRVTVGGPMIERAAETGTIPAKYQVEVGEPIIEQPPVAVEIGEPRIEAAVERGAMPPLPEAARGAYQRHKARMAEARKLEKAGGIGSIAQSLWGKAIKGTETPGEGIIPYAELPESVRQSISEQYKTAGVAEVPIVGFPVGELSTQERALLNRLLQVGQAERPAPTPTTPEQDEMLLRRMMRTQQAEENYQRRRNQAGR